MFRFPRLRRALKNRGRNNLQQSNERKVSAKTARRDMVILLLILLFAPLSSVAGEKFIGVGRSASPAEIKAWDIDVRADFKGLPVGSGSVDKGQQIWESKCESCHGTFGESNEVFTPMVGGTTQADIASGRVATLKRTDFPQRTTLMKLSQLSTLWDYINRAMPWNAPKSLTTDEVYAVTAYILNLGEIVPAGFVLSDKNIREVQMKLPNRNGMVKFNGLWDVNAKADVKNTACMKNCALASGTEPQVTSSIPDFALNHHGNLADQNRLVGGVRGINTGGAVESIGNIPGSRAANQMAQKSVQNKDAAALESAELAKKYSCTSCHAANSKLVGPSYAEISRKYKGDSFAVANLMAKIRSGGSGVWGSLAMPPHANINDADLRALVQWSLSAGQ